MTLDALVQLGKAARGVAVVHPEVTDAELKRMAAGGICGIRFTQFDPKTAATTRDMIEPLAKRVAPLGWHVQIHLHSDQIVDAAGMLQRLPGTMVFDHLGRLAGGVNDPAMGVIRKMLDRGRARADGLGQRLAASDGSRQAGRRGAARSRRGVGGG